LFDDGGVQGNRRPGGIDRQDAEAADQPVADVVTEALEEVAVDLVGFGFVAGLGMIETVVTVDGGLVALFGLAPPDIGGARHGFPRVPGGEGLPCLTA
jgi:hypothetical protein